MTFKIILDASFKRRLKKKPPELQGAVLKCIERLGDDPRHPGLRTSRIQGAPDMWEARVDNRNRVSWKYGEQQGEIIVANHCTHEEVLP